jgi:hypothetical protein
MVGVGRIDEVLRVPMRSDQALPLQLAAGWGTAGG